MSLDAYAICPCGSGKKLKFCCCKDLVHDLEKVTRAIDGDQRAAALDQLNRLIAENGKRAALLALQAETLLVMENLEESAKTNAALLQVMPHSSVGLAIQAVLDAIAGKVDSAVERLQEALEVTDEKMMRIVYSAIALVGNALIETGNVLAGRGHFLLQAAFGGGEDSPAIEALVRLNMTRGLPVLFKQDFQFAECPPGVRWQGEFSAAMKSARRGAWLAACESLESLNQKVPNQSAVWRNIAILRGWLGQDEQAVQAWRTYATLEGVSLDEAIEAEALANLLLRESKDDRIDEVFLTYQVPNTDRLMETLLSDKRAEALSMDLSQLVEEGEPPPKGAFHVFDRPMPASLDEIKSAEDLPIILGEVYVYGRQTDREARLEIALERTSSFENDKTEIVQRLGDLIGKFEKDEIVDQVSRMRAEISINRRMPRDMNVARMTELINEQRRDAYLKRWPTVPMGVLDGKTAREAASIPSLRNRASAAVLNLELAAEEATSESDFDFNELRRQLGLPERVAPNYSGGNIYSISLVGMGRLDYTKLSDEDLVKAYGRLALNGYHTALAKCAEQLVARPSLADRIDLADVYRTLVSVSRDSDKALHYLEKGRRISASRGESQASWYLLELQIRLLRFEGEEANRLIRLISTRHAKEPGVSQQLYTLLVRHGIINPDGTAVQHAAAAERPSPMAAEPAAAPAALWTPDSPAAAPKPESKLWLPNS